LGQDRKDREFPKGSDASPNPLPTLEIKLLPTIQSSEWLDFD
jgi:hypothetical protein